MKRIVDWYWNHAENRPEKWSISSAGLSNIMGITNRNSAIARFAARSVRRPCVAFWGPSQSGKSSFLSKYIDGTDASDLALTWSAEEKVRFSPSEKEVDPNCVVFNPYHAGMDASGLVTRFYLPTEEELAEIDVDAPVEVFLATQKQVLHALAVGYRMESTESENPWTMDALNERIDEPSKRGAKQRDAYELLYDVCDVCENLSFESQKYSRFARSPELRRKILQSTYVDDYQKALSLAAYLLWDGALDVLSPAADEDPLRDLFSKIISVRRVIENQCAGDTPKRVFASMQSAAFLEDIGVLSFYGTFKGDAGASGSAKRRIEALEALRMLITPKGIIITCSDAHYDKVVSRYGRQNIKKASIDIQTFGRFQALIGELKIPVRKTNVVASQPFFDFLGRMDLLDIPGVTNAASGYDKTEKNKIDLKSNPSELSLLSQLYKSGKTLSIVYGQAENCSIDSFVVFVDLEPAGGVRRPATLVNGIRAWLKPFGLPPSSDFASQLPLKLYLNCSLFGKIQDKVLPAITGGGLSGFCEKATKIDFAGSPAVGHFFTSNIYAPCTTSSNKTHFENDAAFRRTFLHGIGRDSLNAVYADGFGTDFMLKTLCAEVTMSNRLSWYDVIRTKDKAMLQAELSRVLPGVAGGEDVVRMAVMKSVFERLMTEVSPEKPDDVAKLVSFIKQVFVVDDNIEPVPASPHDRPKQEIREYLKRQIRTWVDARKDTLEKNGSVEWLVHENEMYPFLESISTIDLDQLADTIVQLFWVFRDRQGSATRSFMAMILNNCFMWGCHRRPESYETGSIYERLCVPFVNRVQRLSTSIYQSEDGRPESLDGDEELVAIVKELNLV